MTRRTKRRTCFGSMSSDEELFEWGGDYETDDEAATDGNELLQ